MRRIDFVRLVSWLTATLLVGAAVLTALFVATRSNLRPSGRLPVIAVSSEPPQAPAPQTPRRRLPEPPTTAPPDADVPEEVPEPLLTVVEITSPLWLTRPRHPERRYPPAAFAAGVAGEVQLDCAVAADGRLDCMIVSETPLGWGFGEAALALASEHVMAPPTQNGTPALGHYRMRIPFRAITR